MRGRERKQSALYKDLRLSWHLIGAHILRSVSLPWFSFMAPFSNYHFFLLFTTLLLFSLQINARDSQFFSKVNHFTSNNNNFKETEFPNKQEEPAFIPETENGYGLYGHETGQNTPDTAAGATTTTAYRPYKTEAGEMSKHNNNNNKYYSYHKNEIGEANFKDGYYNSMENQNHNNNQKYYYNYNDKNGGNYNNRYVNDQRQGMSDMRNMEGGKYFYDIDSERYNPTNYGESSRNMDSRKWNKYFGNNNANFYENNYNSMGGYQRQEMFADDQDDHFEFEP